MRCSWLQLRLRRLGGVCLCGCADCCGGCMSSTTMTSSLESLVCEWEGVRRVVRERQERVQCGKRAEWAGMRAAGMVHRLATRSVC